MTEWDNLLKLLTERYSAKFFMGDKVSNFALLIHDIFKISHKHTPTVAFEINGVQFRLFFHDERLIDFTVWPEQLQCLAGFEAVTNFMREIGEALKEKVFLTPESDPDHPFLEYCPDNRGLRVVQAP